MLNLLIISNSPKAKLIQTFLQPLIKAKVDVVADFDHGLKDVFEKRPATVIIQEQIAGVAGESVARHIQLLLGNGAPTFIMMHEGNPRIRPVKGLFEVIVDLDQTDEPLMEAVLSALKCVVGDEWEKVIVPPHPKAAPVRVVSPTVADEDRVAADKLVEDFFSDMECSEKLSPGQGEGQQADDAGFRVESTSDELAALLVTAAQNSEPLKTIDAEQESAAVSAMPAAVAKRSAKEKTTRTAKVKSASTASVTAGIARESVADNTFQAEEPFDFPLLDAAATPVADIPVRSEVPPAARLSAADTTARGAAEKVVPPPLPADFRISGSPAAYKEQLPEDILMAFDENYRSRSRMWMSLVIVLLVAGGVAGGWYLYSKKPQSLFARGATGTAATAGSAATVMKQPASSPAVQKAATSAVLPVPAAASHLPSFVPVTGRDSAFSAGKPGWERYVDATREIRIYRTSGRIRAIQVVAVKGQVIADSYMRSALREVAGSSEYTLRSRELKQGVVIQRCSIGPTSDLLVYRIQPADTISAFVVSLE